MASNLEKVTVAQDYAQNDVPATYYAPAQSASPTESLEKERRLASMDKERRMSSSNPNIDTTLAVLDLVHERSAHHPMNWPSWKRWTIAFFYCTLQSFVTLTSTTYVSAEFTIGLDFPASSQVLTLGQSLFILGTAVGPAFLGPLSDIGGRKWIYVASIALYAILNIGAAQAINLPMLIVFSFLIGLAGSTALSNVAGTISDLFGDRDIAGQAMAMFVASANIGPSLGYVQHYSFGRSFY